jgi:hypothetical protein
LNPNCAGAAQHPAAAASTFAAKARAEAKEKEEREKSTRRLMREAEYRRKHPPGFAQCGINWYPAGSGWTHCHKCGQPLVYTSDPDANPQECKPRSSTPSTLNPQPSTVCRDSRRPQPPAPKGKPSGLLSSLALAVPPFPRPTPLPSTA